jgi:cyanophycinase
VSIHLVGGGWRPEGDRDVLGGFLDEAAIRAAGSGRMVPRIGVLLVEPEDDEAADDAAIEGAALGDGQGDANGPEDPAARFAGAFAAVAPAQPVVTTVVEGAVFTSAVLSDIDGLVVGGGLAPAYLAAVMPLIDEIRLLVGDGLPYLGYSAGAMIAADRAIVGGWRMDGVPVCPPETAEDLDEVTVAEGIGLVDLAVDVHAAQWGTLSRLVAATEGGLVEGGVAIDEGTVLVVNDDGLRIAGAGNVWRVLDDAAGILVGTLEA